MAYTVYTNNIEYMHTAHVPYDFCITTCHCEKVINCNFKHIKKTPLITVLVFLTTYTLILNLTKINLIFE